jgi:hypothetical protein
VLDPYLSAARNAVAHITDQGSGPGLVSRVAFFRLQGFVFFERPRRRLPEIFRRADWIAEREARAHEEGIRLPIWVRFAQSS